MAYTPHTAQDVREMLASIGVERIDDLFADVPAQLMLSEPVDIPSRSEWEIFQYFEERAAENRTVAPGQLFLGAGAYQHYIPAAVKNLINRGEFVTSYTPYQAEVSQGTLQAIFEFQSHICAITGLDVANASMYDGATALAEALFMAVRVKKTNRVLVSSLIHPHTLAVIRTFMREINVEVVEAPSKNGSTDWNAVGASEFSAVAFQSPNFHGVIEDGNPARAFADSCGALLVASGNPFAMLLAQAPADYRADIAVGEAQPLGIPLQYGGPYCGFFACTKELIRQMPGRIIGRTVDKEGREGFVLTLQTREQHIRREKATSNICTNQGLFALMATMYMTFAGKQGMLQVAETSVARAHALVEGLEAAGATRLHPGAPHFHEAALRLPIPAAEFLARLRDEHGIVGGYDLGRIAPELADCVLVCATEMNSPANVNAYIAAAQAVLAGQLAASR
jgi:glycine dehydrogenase subunit 1